MNRTAEEQYLEREKRLTEAIELKIPDRVPVIANMGYFPARYTGISCEAAWYDYDRWLEAYKKTLQDFQPDIFTFQPFFPGKALEYLEPRSIMWPGHGVSPHHTHQSVEEEYMKADEYEAFFEDISDHMIRVHLSRTCGAAEPLMNLPRLSSLGYGYRGALVLAEALVRPEIAGAIESLQRVGREIELYKTKMKAFIEEIQDLGFSPLSHSVALAPFDALSHSLRGMKGTMQDMYRQPEKVIEACEKILRITLDRPMPPPNRAGNRRIFIPLTRGSDDFISVKHFETFYWPTLKKMIEILIERGATPCIFFEGNFTARLEYLLELPKGKILGQFDTTNIFRAKEVLKDHLCIRGNVPASLLQIGTSDDVRDYCKKLIDVIGKDGGFVLSPRSSTDEANPENLKAMIDFTKEYGVYN